MNPSLSISDCCFRFYLHHIRKFAITVEKKIGIVTNVLENQPSTPPSSPSPFPEGTVAFLKLESNLLEGNLFSIS